MIISLYMLFNAIFVCEQLYLCLSDKMYVEGFEVDLIEYGAMFICCVHRIFPAGNINSVAKNFCNKTSLNMQRALLPIDSGTLTLLPSQVLLPSSQRSCLRYYDTSFPCQMSLPDTWRTFAVRLS